MNCGLSHDCKIIVDFFPNSKRTALELENAVLRAKSDTQKEAFSESLRRHDPLLQRILTFIDDQESLWKENQRIFALGNDLKREAVYFRKVLQDHTERATESLDSKNAKLCEMKKRYKVLEATLKHINNAQSELQDNIKEMYTDREDEVRGFQADLSTLRNTQENEISKWMQVVEQKTLKDKAMYRPMPLLGKIMNPSPFPGTNFEDIATPAAFPWCYSRRN